MLVVRVEFFDVDGQRAVELLSTKIVRGSIRCEEEDLTKTITDKIALLKVVGDRHKVPKLGKRVSEGVYYLNLSISDLEELHETVSSARQRRLIQSIQLERRSDKLHRWS